MTQERFNEVVDEELNRIRSVLITKQQEYNLENSDRLEHFKHAGAMAGWEPEKALYGYMLKHLMSITDMINSGKKFNRELWQEKMGDIHNYLILLLALLEDDDMFVEKPLNRSDKQRVKLNEAK